MEASSRRRLAALALATGFVACAAAGTWTSGQLAGSTLTERTDLGVGTSSGVAALALRADFLLVSPKLGVATLTLWECALALALLWLDLRASAAAVAVALLARLSSAVNGGRVAVWVLPCALAGALLVGARTRLARARSAFAATFFGVLAGGDLAALATGAVGVAGGGVAVVGGAFWDDALVWAPALAAGLACAAPAHR